MSLFSIGLSGLGAAQSALSTTSNNISNVYTGGYNRQLIQLGQNGSGDASGAGVQVEGVQRQYNAYITAQLDRAESRFSALETYDKQISQIDDLLADGDSGLTSLMQAFFSGLEDLSGAPSDAAARQGVLGSSESLVAQFRAYDTYFDDLRDGVNGQMKDIVARVNDLSGQIGGLNEQVSLARAKTGAEPNALLDQRDRLVSELSELVDVNVAVQDGSKYQVSLTSGQPLVAGNKSFALVVQEGRSDPNNAQVAYRGDNGAIRALNESAFEGGELGGLLQSRRETLDGAQNQLGQLAVTLAKSFNDQHSAGTDLNGEAGGNYFSLGEPTVYANLDNAGDIAWQGEFDDLESLRSDDYRLTYEGDGNYRLDNLTSGAQSALTLEDGSLSFGGITLTPSATPALGDSFTVQPTRHAAASLDVELTDTSRIAAAGGDTGGSGDNRNALALQDLQNQRLVGGQATFSGGYASLVSDIGNRATVVKANLETQQGVRDQLFSYQQADSGVNLDEEYANLMRYQQYYSANAKVIEAGASVIDTLLGLRA